MGLELDLLLPNHHQLPPIRTAAPTPTLPSRPGGDNAADVVDDDGGYATPKSAASVLRAPSTCPPAPMKPRPAAKRKQAAAVLTTTTTTHRRACSAGPVRWSFIAAVPHDVLAAVFVARPASAPTTSPPARASKKIRVHVVGS